MPLRRWTDLIPNLVEVVKDTMSYEQETLANVVEGRNHAVAARFNFQKSVYFEVPGEVRHRIERLRNLQ